MNIYFENLDNIFWGSYIQLKYKQEWNVTTKINPQLQTTTFEWVKWGTTGQLSIVAEL